MSSGNLARKPLSPFGLDRPLRDNRPSRVWQRYHKREGDSFDWRCSVRPNCIIALSTCLCLIAALGCGSDDPAKPSEPGPKQKPGARDVEVAIRQDGLAGLQAELGKASRPHRHG